MDEQMREKFETWLSKNPDARFWNATHAMLAAFIGGAALSQPAAADTVNAELLAALQALVDLDDGDKPSLWRFQAEFGAGRAAIAKATP